MEYRKLLLVIKKINMKKERIEALSEILHNLKIQLTEEQIEQIEHDFSLHIEMESEIYSHQFSGHTETCQKCKSLESKLKDAKEDITVYQNSVKSRRNAHSVWTENGQVRYE